ncbi:MAG TPA: ABC transporter ATP-binding protein [Pyrinomonadaceae bacterium]|nr:ABC transporter ATP-binding protein [Pyrinomonadaceae bacterium]
MTRRRTTCDMNPTPDPRPPAPLLSVSDLRKSFRDPAGNVLEVLRGVSFELDAGETLAVVGASGAGKSTLLHLLGGLEAADSGRVRLAGRDVTRLSGREAARLRKTEVGFVFQSHHLLPDLSASENVALPLLVARVRRAEAEARAAELIEHVGLRERAAHRVGELSGGEQQRVAVARALVTRPRLVLADEPTGNLDARTGEEVAALLLASARERRSAVLVATHNEQLARSCDHVVVLRDGRAFEQT